MSQPMSLRTARRAALKQAEDPNYEYSSVYIYRVASRQFICKPGSLIEMPGMRLRMIINTEWARQGWYRQYYPDWYAEENPS